MCQWSTSTFGNCVCIALDMPEWREMTEQIDWRAKQPSHVACVVEDLKYWGAWDTTCGHKDKDIIYHRSPGGDSGEKRKRLTLFLESTREGNRRSDEHWSRFKGNVVETSKRRSGTHMGFSEHIDTTFNWTEPVDTRRWEKLAFCFLVSPHFVFWNGRFDHGQSCLPLCVSSSLESFYYLLILHKLYAIIINSQYFNRL